MNLVDHEFTQRMAANDSCALEMSQKHLIRSARHRTDAWPIRRNNCREPCQFLCLLKERGEKVCTASACCHRIEPQNMFKQCWSARISGSLILVRKLWLNNIHWSEQAAHGNQVKAPRTEMCSEQKGMSRLVSTLPRKSWFFGLLLCYCTDTRHPLLLWFVALLQTEHIVIERRRYYCNRSILTCFKFAITAGWRKQELTRTQR